MIIENDNNDNDNNNDNYDTDDSDNNDDNNKIPVDSPYKGPIMVSFDVSWV